MILKGHKKAIILGATAISDGLFHLELVAGHLISVCNGTKMMTKEQTLVSCVNKCYRDETVFFSSVNFGLLCRCRNVKAICNNLQLFADLNTRCFVKNLC